MTGSNPADKDEMNSKTFAWLMLFFPYLILGIVYPINPMIMSQIAIFGFTPYTILAVGLLFWSKNKTLDKMYEYYDHHHSSGNRFGSSKSHHWIYLLWLFIIIL